MKTSLFAMPRDLDHIGGIRYAKQLGVDAVEPANHHELATPNVEAALRIREEAEKNGIEVCCFSAGIDLSKPGDEGKRAVETLIGYADTARAVGSPFLHHTLCTNYRPSVPGPVPEEIIPVLAERARTVFDYAASIGLRCVYEDQGLVVNGPRYMADFLKELDRPAGIVWDLANVFYVGADPMDMFRAFSDRIVHVHAKDYLVKPAGSWNPGETWEETLDGKFVRGTIMCHGSIDMPAVFGALASIGYRGYVSMEFEGLEDEYEANRIGLDNIRRLIREAEDGTR